MSQNEIPNGWEKLDLSRLPYDKGKSSQKYKDGNLVYLTPEYLRDGSNPTMIATFPKCVFSNVDDTILLWDGSNSGEVFKAKKGILSSTMVKFVVNGICDAQFFYYSLKNQEEKIRAETRGSGIPHVDKSTLSKLKCIKPKSLTEQQKIAKILLTVDQTIDKTKDLIEKHKRIKQGLMRDLFTSKIGWKDVCIKDLLTLLTDFEANGSFEDLRYGVSVSDSSGYAWYVRATDLENKTPLSDVKYVDERSYNFLRKTKLFGNELLITKRGEIGKTYFFAETKQRATLAPNLYLLLLNRKVNSKFLFYYFISDRGQYSLINNNASTTLGALYKDDVKSIKLSIPEIEEQKYIVSLLSSIDDKIKSEESFLQKLGKIKTGLMQDLLTGKVRVTS